MGIMPMKPKSSGLEGLGLGIDNRKENPRPSQRLPGKGMARGRGIPSK